MLEAWERGLEQSPVERGLTLLAAARPGIGLDELAAVSIGERDRRLLALREALFGQRISALTACPGCSEKVELDLTTRDLHVAAQPGGDLTVRHGRHVVELRLPDSRDLLAIASQGEADAEALAFARCVVSARAGKRSIDAAAIPPAVVAEAGRRLAEADPQADMRFALACPACRNEWTAPFDIVQFLWTELNAWASRVFADVHALASAYGWSESEILALRPERRRAYLQMVGV
jgi:hypothetical protein